jgi:hypothetical protein
MTRNFSYPVAGLLWAAASAMTLATSAHAADDSDGAPILPYRPSVSSPAQLPSPGQLEFELGGLRTNDGASRRSSVPYLFKLAFSNEWGLLLGGDAHVWTQGDDGRSRGVGDTVVTLKRAWIVDDASAFGMEFGVKAPTANDAIGSGKADYTVNTIYSRDLGPVHMDANLNATRFGAVELGSARTQFGASTSFSVALSERWGLTGEVSGTHRDGAGNGLQFLSALTFSPSKRLTFDVGVARAVRPRPATNLVFAGVVIPLARLW